MFKYVLPALAGVMLASAAIPAYAADIIIEEPVYEPKYVEPKAFGGWYLRGHIGMSNQQLGSLYNVLYDSTEILEFIDPGHFGSAPTFGVGIGYQVNDWFRADATLEYRGKASFSAFDRYETVSDGDPLTFDGTNDYDGYKSEWVAMGNAYVDLGTIKGFTPYIGAGLGAARVTIHGFTDINLPNAGQAYGATDSKWNFAWAVHAGVGYAITDHATIDFGYSYLDMGDGRTGDIQPVSGTGTIDNPMHFRDITSHDFKLGLRYKF
jgi:opacity protein-like surface antigen